MVSRKIARLIGSFIMVIIGISLVSPMSEIIEAATPTWSNASAVTLASLISLIFVLAVIYGMWTHISDDESEL